MLIVSGGRSPHGERGLKWKKLTAFPGLCCRSPHGERGLKSYEAYYTSASQESLPSRGAWIEMTFSMSCEALV